VAGGRGTVGCVLDRASARIKSGFFVDGAAEHFSVSIVRACEGEGEEVNLSSPRGRGSSN